MLRVSASSFAKAEMTMSALQTDDREERIWNEQNALFSAGQTGRANPGVTCLGPVFISFRDLDREMNSSIQSKVSS